MGVGGYTDRKNCRIGWTYRTTFISLGGGVSDYKTIAKNDVATKTILEPLVELRQQLDTNDVAAVNKAIAELIKKTPLPENLTGFGLKFDANGYGKEIGIVALDFSADSTTIDVRTGINSEDGQLFVTVMSEGAVGQNNANTNEATRLAAYEQLRLLTPQIAEIVEKVASESLADAIDALGVDELFESMGLSANTSSHQTRQYKQKRPLKGVFCL